MTKKKSPESKTDLADFEKTLSELEGLVGELDSDQITLQESLGKFERGVKLYKECYDFLSFAEKKIQVLSDSLNLEDYDQSDIKG